MKHNEASLAILAAMEETPRLYSRPGERTAIDVVAEQHQGLHFELEAWGRWNREKHQPNTALSMEGNWDPGEGGRDSRGAQLSLPENMRHHQLDKVVRYMRMYMCDHGEALKMFYAGVLRKELPKDERLANGLLYGRLSPKTICRILHLRFELFPGHMFYARAAVLNLLRQKGI